MKFGEEKNLNPYADIMDLPHPVSKKHPQMPLIDRAAQFSPFAALTGYGDAIKDMQEIAIERVETEVERIKEFDDI